jgi:hypothetical protein
MPQDRLLAAATIHIWSFRRDLSLLEVGKFKNTNAGKRRYEEEHMAINVVMGFIAVSIPALVYAGCIMTRKKKAPDLPQVAANFELDRAA